MSNSLERQRFEAAFAKRLGKTPAEFVQQKLHSGSKVADIRYQYEIMAVEIARQVNLRGFRGGNRSGDESGAQTGGQRQKLRLLGHI